MEDLRYLAAMIALSRDYTWTDDEIIYRSTERARSYAQKIFSLRDSSGAEARCE